MVSVQIYGQSPSQPCGPALGNWGSGGFPQLGDAQLDGAVVPQLPVPFALRQSAASSSRHRAGCSSHLPSSAAWWQSRSYRARSVYRLFDARAPMFIPSPFICYTFQLRVYQQSDTSEHVDYHQPSPSRPHTLPCFRTARRLVSRRLTPPYICTQHPDLRPIPIVCCPGCSGVVVTSFIRSCLTLARTFLRGVTASLFAAPHTAAMCPCPGAMPLRSSVGHE